MISNKQRKANRMQAASHVGELARVIERSQRRSQADKRAELAEAIKTRLREEGRLVE